MFRRCANVAAFTLICICATAPTWALNTLANPGVAPDVVGLFISGTDWAAIGVDGSFVYQDAGLSGGTAYVGRYFSHECMPDGSFALAFLHYGFDEGGNINSTTDGCGHGYFVDGAFTSIFAETETCPLDDTITTEAVYHTYVQGSGLGALLNTAYCSSLRRGILEHPDLTP